MQLERLWGSQSEGREYEKINKNRQNQGKQPSWINENWLLCDCACQLLYKMIVGKSFFYSAGGNSNNKDAFGKPCLWVLDKTSLSKLTFI